MHTRIRKLGVIGATLVSAGLVLGVAFGGTSAATGTTTTTIPTGASMPMHQAAGMGPMMMMMGHGNGMLGADDMSAAHSSMHQEPVGIVDEELLVACDEAHLSMVEGMTGSPVQDQEAHRSHHGGARS